METKRLKLEPETSAGVVLNCIYNAQKNGFSSVIPAENLDFMLKNSLFKPLDHGEYSGCYLFNEHGRGYGRLPLSNCLIALAAIIFLLPLYILIMGAILVVDGAPVVFSQLRFGRDNTVFRIYKFRTMSSRAEKLHSKMQQRWGQRGHLFKMDNDPRITYLGGFLRKTFLDELPQLVNVVKGDMCLVGARPLPASDEGNYEKECHRLRQRGVPGVTGLWQVSGRNELTFDQMCLLDYYYYCNRSWKLDLKILIRTVKMVLNIGT